MTAAAETVSALSTAVRAALVAAGITTFHAGGPGGPEAAAPYAVVYTRTPLLDGPAGDTVADAVTTVQVKSVSNGAESCEQLGDRVRAALVPRFPAPPGRVLSGDVRVNGGQPATQDPDTTTRLWMMDELFDVPTTPA